jgi:hypothetical protein
MRGAIPPIPHYVFMVWCLVRYRDNFTFYLDFLENKHLTEIRPLDHQKGANLLIVNAL